MVIAEDAEWIRDTPELQNMRNEHIRISEPQDGHVIAWLDGEALEYRHDKRLLADEESVYLDKFHTSESYNGDLPLNDQCKHQMREQAICAKASSWDKYVHIGCVPSIKERETVLARAKVRLDGDKLVPAHASSAQ